MNIRVIWFFTLASMLFGCSSNKGAQKTSSNSNHYQNDLFNPLLYLYHNNESSSTLYFDIEPSEVLFTRPNPESPFKSNIKIAVLLYEIKDTKKSFLDTFKTRKTFINQKDLPLKIQGEISLPLQGDKDYFLIVNCIDLNKNHEKTYNLWAPKSNLNHPMNFLILDDSTKRPLFNYQKIGAGNVSIYNSRNPNNHIWIREIDLSKTKFPPPPFASRQVFLPDLPEETIEVSFLKENFAYFITTTKKSEEGITIAVRDPYFPEVKLLEQMALPLRYITTKSEYEELASGLHTKKSLDDFWLKCGGSKERAKQLIRVYYKRVTLANKYFSTINPGYKTDRGAIYIIYGKPSQVQKRKNQETWFYGDITNPNSLSFTFIKKPNIYSNNQYELQRNSGYRIHWQRAVTNWINGRVYERK